MELKRHGLLSLVMSMVLLTLAMFTPGALADTGMPYYIEVDVGNQIVTIYEADTMTVVRQMLCSSGKKARWTPLGDYVLPEDERHTDRGPWYKIGDIYVRYATRLSGKILFHSIPYYMRSANCIDPNAVKQFGMPASHGCIRLRWQDAKFIAENCLPGTHVKIVCSETRNDELRSLLLQESYDASKGLPYESFLGISSDPNVMDRHSKGQAVLDLQYRLRDLGVYDGDINGEYDSATINAVRYAQCLLGFDASGMASPDFLTAIYEPDAPAATNVRLETGMSGPAVKQLQGNLKVLRLYNDALDSVYDAAVVDAVKQFQRAYGYDQDGVAGPTVQKAIAYEAGRVAGTFGESDYTCAWVGDPVLLARVNVKEDIKLRESPSMKARQLRRLSPDRMMVVVERGDDWSRVRVGGVEGYVSNALIAFGEKPVALLKYTSVTEDLVYAIGNDASDYLTGTQLPCEVFEAYLAANDQQVDVNSLDSFVTVTTGEGDAPLNLREAPDGESTVLDTVKNGENLRAVRRTSEWTEVSYDGKTGYLMNRYLTFWTGPKDALEAREEAGTARASATGYARVVSASNERAAVYEEDREDARVLGHLADGTVLEVLDSADGWCRIQYKGHEGYMIGEDLEIESASEDLRKALGPSLNGQL